ncbi:endopeptidase La [bacterium]|nr:endopeptidase La [candidate division CSSED10-310 bacterium]
MNEELKVPVGINKEEKEEEHEIPRELPVLPLRGTIIYPAMVIPLMVGRPKSIKLIDEALIGDKMIGLVAQKNPEDEDPDLDELYEVGTTASILKMIKMPDDSIRIMVHGLDRVRFKRYLQTEPYLKAEIEPMAEILTPSKEVEAFVRNIKTLFQRIVDQSPHLPAELGIMVLNISEPGKLADMVASGLNLNLMEKQELLEMLDIKNRLEKIHFYLNKELEILEIGNKIQTEIKSEMDKTQREFLLRQQLKALQKELGESDERQVEIDEIRKRILKARMPKAVKEVADKELERLANMPPAAAEYTVSRTYLDWLIELPWSKSTRDNLNIGKAEDILDEDHYDLKKVKERVLEYLAVRKLKKDMKGPILCFVGPPGVGKTSFGKSIARAVGRKFIRLSLGGVRDEAEIRGHRRTYVGALPGRIIQGIRRAGSNNPVFMLDEVDKIGMDFRGDPASALLEVLDPEQNFSFSDHYLDVDFDLSKVMFITTANILDTIPPALRDRMEVLRLPGYIVEDKIQIAKQFLVPKQLNENGLTAENITFTDAAISRIITEYTREAGVRNLEREIATICRKVARKVAGDDLAPVAVDADLVSTYLGPLRFFSDLAERTAEPGVAIGLAWTPVGGDIMFIEATRMQGKKSMILTGSLGDVMKESAQAALSYIRANTTRFDIPADFYESSDFHVHVPEGAIPKDGPSAGVTIFIALLSILTGKPLRDNLAMTGEITLRGQILPVGGIKEKVLAAHRAGITTVLLPEQNEKDLEDVPAEVLKSLNIKLLKRMDELPALALCSVKEKKAGRPRKK